MRGTTIEEDPLAGAGGRHDQVETSTVAIASRFGRARHRPCGQFAQRLSQKFLPPNSPAPTSAPTLYADLGELGRTSADYRTANSLVLRVNISSCGQMRTALWRRGRDSNPRYPYEYAAFRVRCFQPLSHLSGSGVSAEEGWLVARASTLIKIRQGAFPACCLGRSSPAGERLKADVGLPHAAGTRFMTRHVRPGL